MFRDRIKSLRRVKASELIPNPKNWRTHPPEQAAALQAVLAEVGFAGAALAYETPDGLMLIDGHLRSEVAPEQKIPVLVLDVTPDEADKLLATFDPLTAMAGQNDERLRELWGTLELDSAALNYLLKTLLPVELPAAGAGGDEFDATPQESGPTRTSPGELWVIGGKHRLLVGDSTQAADLAKVLGGDAIWVKQQWVMGRQDYQWRHEPILYGWNGGASHYFVDDRTQDTVIESDADVKKLSKVELVTLVKQLREPAATTVIHENRPHRNDLHPTMKPIALVTRLLRNSSRDGEIVYDGFGGSGSTLIACHRTRRKAVLIEIEPRYADVILKRAEAEGLTCERQAPSREG